MCKFKHFLIVIGILTSCFFKAQDISEEKAQIVAKNFISLYSKNGKSSEIQLINITHRINNNYNGFYVFKNATVNGFYIISATRKNHPVLAYSFDSNIDENKIQSPEFLYLLNGYQECNAYLSKNKSSKISSEEDTKIFDEWEALLSASNLPPSQNSKVTFASSVSPLIKTNWSQSTYYNKLTPVTYEGKSSMTGCVATAMAQIMKFWNYPAKGNGSHTYTISDQSYNWKGKTLTANFGSTNYSWNNMPNSLSASSSTQQVDAVSTLMLHAGISIDMMYGPTASIAGNSNVVSALKYYFKYSSDISLIYKSRYTSDSEWLNLIKEQLTKGYPVYFTGTSSLGSGHAFVADGYDANNLVHFNLGWGGYANGYYQITNPGGFSNNQAIITNISPFTPTCTSPTGLSVSNILANSATLKWYEVNGAKSYTVEYKPATANSWTVATASTSASSFTLSGLKPTTVYLWRVKANCSASDTSLYAQNDFTTQSSCSVPTGLSASDLSANSATFNWYVVDNAQNYTLEYKLATASTWTVAATSTNATNFTLSGLKPNTIYHWRVKSNCSTSVSSGYALSSFTTLSSCTNPKGGVYAANISSNSAVLKWYPVSGSQSYTLEYKAGNTANWTIANASITTPYFNLTGLKANTAYYWRVKTNCSTSNSSGYTEGYFTTSNSCPTPTGASTYNILTTSAVLRWHAMNNAKSYTVEYKIASATQWTVAATSITSTSFTLSGLAANTTYYWRIKTNCSAFDSSGYDLNAFTTLPTCTTPTGFTISDISSTSAILRWYAMSGAQSYTVEYKLATAANWTVVSVSTKATSFSLSGLKANTMYHCRVKTNCPTDSSSGYAQSGFTTLSSCLTPTGTSTSNVSVSSAILKWNTMSGAKSYTIEYKLATEAYWSVATTSTTATSFTLSGLKANTAYQWRIKTNCSTSDSSGYVQNGFTTFSNCTTPTSIYAYDITTTSAVLRWYAMSGAQSYTLEYRPATSTNWTIATTSTTASYFTLSGLKANTSYYWRVKTNCSASDNSGYAQGMFTTKNSCSTPAGVTASKISSTSADLTWYAVSGAQSYTVEFKQSSETTWKVATASTTSTYFTLSGLKANTAYDWMVKSNCSANSSSGYARTGFTTLSSCVTPTGISAFDVSSGSAVLRWHAISDAKGYTVEYKISSDINWTVATASTTSTSFILSGLKAGTAYQWRVKTNCSASSSSAYAQSRFSTLPGCSTPEGIYLYNISANSADLKWYAASGVKSYTVEYKQTSATNWTLATASTTTPYFTFSGLKANTAYQWRVKTNCSASESSGYAQGSFSTLNNCSAPTGLSASNISDSSVSLKWYVVNGAQSYRIEYKLPTETNWTVATASTSSSSFTLSGLRANTFYIWRVKTNCSTSNSSEYTQSNFTTLSSCTTPTGLLATDISDNSVIFKWYATAGALSYTVEYKTSSATNWTTATSMPTSSFFSLTGLKANIDYYWRVKTNCAASHSSDYNQSSFRTNSSSTSTDFIEDNPYSNKSNAIPSSILVYPNPVENTIFIKGLDSNINNYYLITILDRNGKLIKTATIKPAKEITLDVSELTPNLYFLRIKDRTFKFIKK
ncbi:fibronectin type III domain-containing protein [Apibacter raozihei]|uniref:fibronectin type III domain-containing protein n=1 Tax=Apibacter raozihei TaxID=2500547 RepID=UPI000FE3B87A|nr:fibronectin type III domain-containing protein [Apibacter raozihei]